MSDFRKTLSVSAIPPGGAEVVELDGREIAIFNVGGRFHAIDNACPHRGGPLADGALDGTRVTCPLHRWQFDVATGENPVNPELRVRRYPVRVEGADVFVDLDDSLGIPVR